MSIIQQNQYYNKNNKQFKSLAQLQQAATLGSAEHNAAMKLRREYDKTSKNSPVPHDLQECEAQAALGLYMNASFTLMLFIKNPSEYTYDDSINPLLRKTKISRFNGDPALEVSTPDAITRLKCYKFNTFAPLDEDNQLLLMANQMADTVAQDTENVVDYKLIRNFEGATIEKTYNLLLGEYAAGGFIVL